MVLAPLVYNQIYAATVGTATVFLCIGAAAGCAMALLAAAPTVLPHPEPLLEDRGQHPPSLERPAPTAAGRYFDGGRNRDSSADGGEGDLQPPAGLYHPPSRVLGVVPSPLHGEGVMSRLP